jgi:hypothetical protein
MKFKLASLLRSKATVIGASVVATLAIGAVSVPEHASAATVRSAASTQFVMCNYIGGSLHPIAYQSVDAWLGTTFLGKASPFHCTTLPIPINSDVDVNFFIDNVGTWIGYYSFYSNHRVEFDITGSVTQPVLNVS